MRSRSKYAAPVLPAANAGLTLHCSRTGMDCHWVRLVLAEKDVEAARVQLLSGSRPSEDLLLLNPSHSLPTLVERDLTVYPAGVIVEYLDERYPHPRLMPSDPAARARARQGLLQIRQSLQALLEPPATGVSAARQRQIAVQIETIHRLWPARGWFLGADYGLVDALWSVVLWQLQSWPEPLLSPVCRENLRRYGSRLWARPAFQRSQPPALPGG